jgi:hypothetical protein
MGNQSDRGQAVLCRDFPQREIVTKRSNASRECSGNWPKPKFFWDGCYLGGFFAKSVK